MSHIVNGELYTDVMVDIETTGLEPERTAILQISAVKFNLGTRKVCPDLFNKSLDMATHRFWNQGTLNWWQRDKAHILRDITFKQEDWRKVMTEFAEWCYPLQSLRFWSKPTHFDYSFLDSYFKDAGLITPFSYRDATDLNSFIRGLYHNRKENPPAYPVEFEGDAHNAIFDTLNQIKTLFWHCDNIKGPTDAEVKMMEAEYEVIN